ncbi:MAG TPA: serine hydrolase domain-containing protein, partial [Thermoanaerobaculia bacterium]|nr:serine hydrolase domain-containing protein [Thermoanaerobaculia bacterium]
MEAIVITIVVLAYCAIVLWPAMQALRRPGYSPWPAVGAAALLVPVFATAAWAQEPADLALRARADALAATALSSPLAGISVAVARNGQIVLARGYGMADLSHGVAVTPETVFHIDSISKNILAGVVLKLVDDG